MSTVTTETMTVEFTCPELREKFMQLLWESASEATRQYVADTVLMRYARDEKVMTTVAAAESLRILESASKAVSADVVGKLSQRLNFEADKIGEDTIKGCLTKIVEDSPIKKSLEKLVAKAAAEFKESAIREARELISVQKFEESIAKTIEKRLEDVVIENYVTEQTRIMVLGNKELIASKALEIATKLTVDICKKAISEAKQTVT